MKYEVRNTGLEITSNAERRLLNEEVENIQLPESHTLYLVQCTFQIQDGFKMNEQYSPASIIPYLVLCLPAAGRYFVLDTKYLILDTYV